MNDLIVDLYQKNCIKLGSFKLKNNDISPIYIDMKNIISYPYIVNSIISLFSEKILQTNFKLVCGIPYGGMHIASIVSYKYNYPLLLLRKETKSYGTKKILEGEYHDNDKCIVFEDVITTGSSLVKYLKTLTRHKIVVNDVFVICDRKQVKNDNLLHYNVHTLFTMYDVLNILLINNNINMTQMESLTTFVAEKAKKNYNYSYEDRKRLTTNGILKDLYDIIISKRSLIILNCSKMNDAKIIIQYANLLGNYICLLHINSSAISDLSQTIIDGLQKLAIHYNFKIMDYANFNRPDSIYNWAPILFIDGLKVNNDSILHISCNLNERVFISNTVIDNLDHLQESICKYSHNYAKEHKQYIIGLCANSITEKDPSLIYMAPEINKTNSNYLNKTTGIYEKLFENNIDLISLGNDFLKLPNMVEKIDILQKMLWTIYFKSIRVCVK